MHKCILLCKNTLLGGPQSLMPPQTLNPKNLYAPL